MKSLRFSRDSWHYKLVNATGYGIGIGEEIDLCGYTWRVIGTILLFALLSLIAVGVGVLVIHFLLGIGFSLAYGAWLFNDIGFAGFVISIFAFSTWAVTKLNEWQNNRRYREKPKKPDGFIKNAYKSTKEKYCARVKFDEDVPEAKGEMI
jgi:hypothetical protein